MRFIILSAILAFSTATFADIKISSISGYSRITNFIPNGVNGSVIIGGGLGGDQNAAGCASKDNVSTCNNCADGYAICNERRIYDSLRLTIQFASTSAFGTPKMVITNGTTETNLSAATPPNTTSATNQQTSISVTWATIIAALVNATDPTCEASSCTQQVRVGIGTDLLDFTLIIYKPGAGTQFLSGISGGSPSSCTAGVCNFSLFPGDEKAYIENVKVQSPSGTRPIIAIKFLCAEGTDFSAIPSYPFGVGTVTVSGDNILEDHITGLSNNVDYVCRTASEDDTGNILYYTNSDGSQDAICPEGTTNCHQVRPDAVVGLFAEKTNCFIATAAYGSPWMEEVKTLRKFRSEYLLTNRFGRAFTRWYYNTAPAYAQWISESPERRWVARTLLTPVFVSAYLLVNWPMSTMIVLFASLFAFMAIVIRRKFITLRSR